MPNRLQQTKANPTQAPTPSSPSVVFPSRARDPMKPGTPSAEVTHLQAVLAQGLAGETNSGGFGSGVGPGVSTATLGLSVGSPRSAKVLYEKPLPEGAHWLLLTTPPPPSSSSASTYSDQSSAPAPAQAYRPAVHSGPSTTTLQRSRSHVDASPSQQTTTQRVAGKASGYLTKGLAALGLSRLDRRPSTATLSPKEGIKPSPSSDNLQLTKSVSRQASEKQTHASATAAVARRARLDSSSLAHEIPKSWPEYSIKYARGEIDIQDPPFPPIDAPPVFPSAAFGYDSLGSPFDDQNYRAPLSPVEPLRQKVLARLDLLGLGIAAAAAMGAGPQSAAMGRRESRQLSSGGSSLASSTWSPGTNHDSFGSFRRGSTTSTAPSSIAASPKAASAHSPAIGALYPSYPAHHSLRNDPALLRVLDKAHRTFGTKIVCISILLEDSQVFLASDGMPHGVESLPRHAALDSHTILNADRGLVVADLEKEWRFRNNVLCVVLGARFYAGSPIYAPLGSDVGHEFAGRPLAIGCISLIDDRPNFDFGDRHLSTLRSLAREVGAEIETWTAKQRSGRRPTTANSIQQPPSISQRPAPVREVTFEDSLRPATPPRAPSPQTGRVTITHTRRFSIEGLPTPPLEKRPSSSTMGRLDSERGRALTSGVVRAIDYGSPSSVAAGTYRFNPSPPLETLRPALVVEPRRARSISPNARSQIHTNSRPPVSSRSVRSAGSTRSSKRRQKEKMAELPPALPTPRTAASLGVQDSYSPRTSEDSQPGMVIGPSSALGSTSEKKERPISRTPQEKIYGSAMKAIGTALKLDLVYLVSLDLTGPALDPPKLRLLAGYGLASDLPSFEPSLHLQALRSPQGGLLYRNPSVERGIKWQGSGYATGVILPVKDSNEFGWVLAGYSADPEKEFVEVEVEYLRSVAEQLAKLVEV